MDLVDLMDAHTHTHTQTHTYAMNIIIRVTNAQCYKLNDSAVFNALVTNKRRQHDFS